MNVLISDSIANGDYVSLDDPSTDIIDSTAIVEEIPIDISEEEVKQNCSNTLYSSNHQGIRHRQKTDDFDSAQLLHQPRRVALYSEEIYLTAKDRIQLWCGAQWFFFKERWIRANENHFTHFIFILMFVTLVILISHWCYMSQHSSDKKHHHYDDGSSKMCYEPDYFSRIVKEQYTIGIAGVLRHLSGLHSFEASAVTYDRSRNAFWVVFDNTYHLGMFRPTLSRADDHQLVPRVTMSSADTEYKLWTTPAPPPPSIILHNNEENSSVATDDSEQRTSPSIIERLVSPSPSSSPPPSVVSDPTFYASSGFEGLIYDDNNDIFYLLTEATAFATNEFYGMISTAEVHSIDNALKYEITSTCMINFPLPSDNKGFESFVLMNIGAQRYFVAMCEGNYCESGKKGRDYGHGRLVIVRSVQTSMEKYPHFAEIAAKFNINCMYEYITVVDLPEAIAFVDYSVLTMEQTASSSHFTMTVVSQQNSSLWTGTLIASDIHNFQFGDGTTLYFPKNNKCQTRFCNVEGLVWLDQHSFVAVSDRAKGMGEQPFMCKEKDQSIHIFTIP